MSVPLSTSENANIIPFSLHEKIFPHDPAVHPLTGQTLVVKLGGSTLEHQREVLQDILNLQTLGVHPVLVHGGGPYINEWLQALHIPTRFERGLPVPDPQTLQSSSTLFYALPT